MSIELPPWLGALLALTVFKSLWSYLASCVLLAVAQAVYALFGFGAGLIAVGSLAMIHPQLQDVVVILLLTSLPLEAWVVYHSRREICWQGVGLILVGILVGLLLGTLLLKQSNPTVVLALLGGVLILAGILFLLQRQVRPVQWPGWTHFPFGLLSGVLAGAFGTGGPPLILYYRLAGVDKTRFRGQLMTIFFIMALLRVPLYAQSGLLTVPRLIAAVSVLPGVLLGAALGYRSHLRLAETTFQKLVAAALVILGLLLVLGQ